MSPYGPIGAGFAAIGAGIGIGQQRQGLIFALELSAVGEGFALRADDSIFAERLRGAILAERDRRAECEIEMAVLVDVVQSVELPEEIISTGVGLCCVNCILGRLRHAFHSLSRVFPVQFDIVEDRKRGSM